MKIEVKNKIIWIVSYYTRLFYIFKHLYAVKCNLHITDNLVKVIYRNCAIFIAEQMLFFITFNRIVLSCTRFGGITWTSPY